MLYVDMEVNGVPLKVMIRKVLWVFFMILAHTPFNFCVIVEKAFKYT